MLSLARLNLSINLELYSSSLKFELEFNSKFNSRSEPNLKSSCDGVNLLVGFFTFEKDIFKFHLSQLEIFKLHLRPCYLLVYSKFLRLSVLPRGMDYFFVVYFSVFIVLCGLTTFEFPCHLDDKQLVCFGRSSQYTSLLLQFTLSLTLIFLITTSNILYTIYIIIILRIIYY